MALAFLTVCAPFAQAAEGSRYAAIVVEAETGKILHADQAESLRHPASLTKIMTLYMTFKAIRQGKLAMGKTLLVSDFAAAQSPSKLGLRAGRRISVRDAVMGLITESANDAAVVLAEAIGGSEARFAQLMTRQARELGMERTVFQNASGLPDTAQVTTARDMAVLARAIYYHFPEHYGLFSTKSFNYGGVTHRNHNRLMARYAGMDGIKTGFIRASGFNLVATAKRGKTRLIGVVFGGSSATARDNHMASLLDENFARFTPRTRGIAALTLPETTAVAQADIPRPGRKPVPEQMLAQGDQALEDEAPAPQAAPTPAVARFDLAGTPTIASPAETSSRQQLAMLQLPAAAAAAPNVMQDAPMTLSTPPISGNVAVYPQKRADTQKRHWGLQVGAYASRAASEGAIQRVGRYLPEHIGAVQYQVVEVKANAGRVYRARVVGLDEKAARSICASMMRDGQGCMTLGPELLAR